MKNYGISRYFTCGTVTTIPEDQSYIIQKPLDGSESAILELHSRQDWQWALHLTARDRTLDSEGQMYDIFLQYKGMLSEKGMTVADNCVRTWIFVRDIDHNYKGVVEGRKRFFNEEGLTPSTHFIASTGIEGEDRDPDVLVVMDAVAIPNLDQSKVRYLQALDHLNPTYEYGVTFERGTAIDFADEKVIFISGTASIDSEGRVLHKGDAGKQTLRAIENIEALLKDAGASLTDVESAIVYLRNDEDLPAVNEALARSHFSIHECVTVHAPVCRPDWLVEIECIAVTHSK